MQPNDWPLLTGVWVGLKRLAAVSMAALLGAWTGAVIFGLLTLYVYGLGIYLGLPAGFMFGGYLGYKHRLANTAFVFTAAVASYAIAHFIVGTPPETGIEFLNAFIPAAVSAVVVLISLKVVGFVPASAKKWIGGVGSTAIIGGVALVFLRQIYTD